ncbi:MAG: argininosuccinate lyase, partial [Rhizobiaceae bacterium]|nr:argininosuccinate lyase [Rhizobiaceae bacterium]
GLEALSLEALQALEPRIRENVFDVLGVDASVRSRTSFGGTAPDNVKREIAAWRERLARPVPA